MKAYATTFQRQSGGAWGISLIGVALGGAAVAYGISIAQTNDPLLYPLLDFLLLATMAGTVAASGFWLGKSDIQGPELWQIATWVGLGVILTAVLTGWQLLAQARQGAVLQQPMVTLALTQTVGAVAGLLVGVYHVRSVRRAREVKRAREDAQDARETARNAREAEDQLRFLNHLLRHHLFNGMQVIRSNADFLSEYVDGEGSHHVETIRRRSERLVRLVENMRVLVESLSGDRTLEAVDLIDTLDHELGVIEQTYGTEVFDADGLDDEIHVTADQLLPTVFENLLRTAVEHSASHVPEVDVHVETTEDTAVVIIENRGNALADGVERHFSESADIENATSEESTGFYVARRLVNDYGGDITVEETDDGSTHLQVTLALADPETPSPHETA